MLFSAFGSAPSSAKVDVWPTKGQRNSFTIFPWQRLDLAFGYTYRARKGSEMTAVQSTIKPVRYLIRKRGMTFPISKNRYMDGSTGSGQYKITTTFRYATDYYETPYYETKKVWQTRPVTCQISSWKSGGGLVPITSYVADVEDSDYFYGDYFAWMCRNPDGSKIAFVNTDLGEHISSPWFVYEQGKLQGDSGKFASRDDYTRVWSARTAGSAPCQGGIWSGTEPFFCVEDFQGVPVSITAEYHFQTKQRVKAGQRAHWLGWRTRKVSKIYTVTVK
ncbi:MAG: hypothetical protein U0R23_06570 [Candidatus Nanopelagicales bacterium]